MPTWLPTRLLDQAEQRDFLGGVQPYMADLQQQVQRGLSDLTATARGMAQQVMAPAALTGAPGPLPGLDTGGDRGYLDAAAPAPRPVPLPSAPTAPAAPAPAPSQTTGPLPAGLPVSAIEPFTLPSFETLTGATSAAVAAPPSAATAPKNSTDPSPFTMPSWQDLTGFAEPVRQAVAGALPGPATPGSAPATSAAPATPAVGPPSRPGEIEAYIRAAAAARGIDPDTAIKVVQAEGGLVDPVRQSDVVYQGRRETSYGPLQLNTAGGVGSAALKAGIDPRDPAQWRQAVDFGLDEVARSGWGQWHGAARVGVGPRQGIGGPRAAPGPAQAPLAPPQGASAPPLGTYTKDLVPNQITEGAAQGLTSAEALAVCGPAAAVAFARANGRNPTLREAKELASSLGVWDVEAGMHGPATQVQLLEKMGVPARLEQGTDWGRVAAEVQRGKPVIVDTPNHYFVASGFDPATGEFEFGASAGVLRAAKGKTRWRPADLPSLNMGSPRATIYMGAR